MNVLEHLAATPPRDRSGSVASNRLDFQIDWALCFIINLHKAKLDYAVILDYHDDITVLNSETNPTKASFYQIKTDKGNWTCSKLIERDGEKSHSIVGKLFEHRKRFPGLQSSISLVVTSELSEKLHRIEPLFRSSTPSVPTTECERCVPHSKLCVSFTELNIEAIKTFSRKIKEEYGTDETPDWSNDFWIITTDIPVEKHENWALAELTKFLDEIDHKYASMQFFRTIKDHLRRRSNFESKVASVEDLKKQKSFCHSEFENILRQLHPDHDAELNWPLIANELQSAGFALRRLLRIHDSLQKYAIQRISPGVTIIQLRKRAVAAINQAEQIGYDSIADMIAKALPLCGEVPRPFDECYLIAVMLTEWVDEQRQLSTANSELEET